MRIQWRRIPTEGIDDGVGGLDKFCEIAVGRVPFYGNFADLDRILAKTVRYMQETDISWRCKTSCSPPARCFPRSTTTTWPNCSEPTCWPPDRGVYRVYDSAFGVSPEKTPTTEPNVLDAWKSNPSGYHMWLTHGFCRVLPTCSPAQAPRCWMTSIPPSP